MTEPARAALAVLRSPANFDWTIVYLLVLTMFIYSGEIMAQRWNVIAAGLALWFADWINELVNSAILFWTGRAPLWVETGHTSYQILVGLNAETTLLFLIYGMAFAKLLPENPRAKIFGLNSRWMLIVGQSIAIGDPGSRAESMGLPELVLALLESWRGTDLDRHLRIRLVFRGRCVGA